jgi:hypothetical protein
MVELSGDQRGKKGNKLMTQAIHWSKYVSGRSNNSDLSLP